MTLSRRLLASLMAAVTLVSVGIAWTDVRARSRQLRDELAKRTAADALTVEQAVAPLVVRESASQVGAALDRASRRQGLEGVALYDGEGHLIAAATSLSDALRQRTADAVDQTPASPSDVYFRDDGASLLMHIEPAHEPGRLGSIVVLRSADDVDRAVAQMWRDEALRAAIEIALMVGTTLLLVRWSVVRPLARTASWLQAVRLGKAAKEPSSSEGELFRPLLREVVQLVRSLEVARATAEEEARLRDTAESVWTAERLRARVRGRLQHSPLFVVSNREPYSHVRRGGTVETLVPASGLVTALEPILRACDGTWIAHGSGDADREYVDDRDRLRVPPEHPEYTLRRVWIGADDEEGYYYGFSNEGLWPLCHIAHTRPLFRSSDWAAYERVNELFAEAVLDELAGTESPIVLVQDYHFALLPRLVKQRRPDARVGVFWHIPWPNAEAFGICPWQHDLLDGLLGADLIGFHTQAHCNNFLGTVDRAFESQIEWEHFTVKRHDHVTAVRPFPISVDVSSRPAERPGRLDAGERKAGLLRALGTSADLLGIGVDRVDYTKGILERLRGLERFFEKWDRYVGRLTFVQIGAPSRTRIKRYHDLLDEVIAEAERINARFRTSTWRPIALMTRHHSHEEIQPYYEAADLCLITALHDGMNLVAKEFVSARTDEDGVLVLSQFTGACRELRDAVIVNPYDTEQVADAIRRAIEMDPHERRSRMRRMRATVREHNVYRWAATLINDLADVRLEPASITPFESARVARWRGGRRGLHEEKIAR